MQRGDGVGRMRFSVAAGRDGGRITRLAEVHQRYPIRVLLPHPGQGEPPTAVVITTSGGLAGGDRIRLEVAADAGAVAAVTSQAAEKVYRSLGPDARVDAVLTAGAGAWLEWLPQETILFDGARLARSTALAVEAGGQLLAVESIVFGRIARGEAFTRGRLAEDWRITIGGRLAWADALRLDEPLAPVFAAAAGLAGARALATLVLVGADAPAARDLVRAVAESFPSVRIGATAIGSIAIARFLGSDPQVLRTALAAAVGALRASAAGLPNRAPRIWYG